MRIRTATIEATITQIDGITYTTLGDLHEFYFRGGRENDGEESGAWFLVEWRDQGSRSSLANNEEVPTPVLHRTWWELKCFYHSP